MAFAYNSIELSVICKSMRICGDVSCGGDLQIDGVVEGRIACKGRVDVANLAKVHGDVTARSVIIAGCVKGDITAHEIWILPGGSFEGRPKASKFKQLKGSKFIATKSEDTLAE